jgi:hypothetical protein
MADPEPVLVEAESPEAVLDLGLAGSSIRTEPEESEVTPEEAPEEPVQSRGPTCLYCGGSLPTDRTVNFCPHCGQSQTQILCPECRSEVEPGWRHCVNCGAAVGEA